MIAVAIVTSIESRVADRRRIEGSGFKPAVPSRLFSCGGPETGRSEWVLGGEGSTAHDEVKQPSEGCWERIEEERWSSSGERATFIDVESGGGPVRAPCPKQRVAKPGGANRRTEIINKKRIKKEVLNFIRVYIIF
jgi:hypothetical protein